MEHNLTTDPFATNETTPANAVAGRQAQMGRGQPAPARKPNRPGDPPATNPLPEVADPVMPAMEPGNDQVRRHC